MQWYDSVNVASLEILISHLHWPPTRPAIPRDITLTSLASSLDRLKRYELSQAFYDTLRNSLRDFFTMSLDLYRLQNTCQIIFKFNSEEYYLPRFQISPILLTRTRIIARLLHINTCLRICIQITGCKRICMTRKTKSKILPVLSTFVQSSTAVANSSEDLPAKTINGVHYSAWIINTLPCWHLCSDLYI